LSEEDDLETIELGNRPLFTQMDVLVHFAGEVVGWKQVARSVRFCKRKCRFRCSRKLNTA